MKKLLFLFILLMSFVPKTYAQTHNEDIVYLVNGGVIQGTILEQIPNKTVKIKSETGQIFVLTMDEISKISKEESNTDANTGENKAASPPQPNTFKYINIIEPAVGLGLKDNSDVHSFGLRNIFGVLCNDAFTIGLGIGVDGYASPDANLSSVYFFSIFLHARAYFIKSTVSPYLSGDIGYSVLLNGVTGTHGGLILNPVFGIKIDLSKYTALTLGVGYRIQNYGYTETISYGYYGNTSTTKNTTTFTADFLDIHLGLAFH